MNCEMILDIQDGYQGRIVLENVSLFGKKQKECIRIGIVEGDGKESSRTSDANELDVPMCVLINENTASAGELFASALQDYDKAALVGTVTYGKGTVQRILSLPDGTGLGISYSMYYPPFSDNYEGIGVQPDYPCEMDEKLANKSIYKITDAEDTQLQKAIEVLGKAE